MLCRLKRAAHNVDVNVRCDDGRHSKWEIQLIQLVNRALAQSAAVMGEKKLPLATVMHVATGG